MIIEMLKDYQFGEKLEFLENFINMVYGVSDDLKLDEFLCFLMEVLL